MKTKLALVALSALLAVACGAAATPALDAETLRLEMTRQAVVDALPPWQSVELACVSEADCQRVIAEWMAANPDKRIVEARTGYTETTIAGAHIAWEPAATPEPQVLR